MIISMTIAFMIIVLIKNYNSLNDDKMLEKVQERVAGRTAHKIGVVANILMLFVWVLYGAWEAFKIFAICCAIMGVMIILGVGVIVPITSLIISCAIGVGLFTTALYYNTTFMLIREFNKKITNN